MKYQFISLYSFILPAVSAQVTQRFAAPKSEDTQWYIQFRSPDGIHTDPTKPAWGMVATKALENATSPLPGSVSTRNTAQYSQIYFDPVPSHDWSDSAGISDEFYRGDVWAEAVHYGSNGGDARHSWLPASYDGFFIGSRANFTTSTLVDPNPPPDYHYSPGAAVTNSTWSSLPFGLALGTPFNVLDDKNVTGSIVFGGSYDWARINDTQWHKLPLGNTTGLLAAGKTSLPDGSARVGNITQNVALDFQTWKLLLPQSMASSGASCNGSIKMVIAGASFDYGTNRDNCDFHYGDDADTVTLGILFFRNMYLYADMDGSVYVARALQTNAPVSVRTFDANTAIEQHPEAKYVAPPASGGANVQNPGALLLASLAGMAAFVML